VAEPKVSDDKGYYKLFVWQRSHKYVLPGDMLSDGFTQNELSGLINQFTPLHLGKVHELFPIIHLVLVLSQISLNNFALLVPLVHSLRLRISQVGESTHVHHYQIWNADHSSGDFYRRYPYRR
jgi:hypothetical protein